MNVFIEQAPHALRFHRIATGWVVALWQSWLGMDILGGKDGPDELAIQITVGQLQIATHEAPLVWYELS